MGVTLHIAGVPLQLAKQAAATNQNAAKDLRPFIGASSVPALRASPKVSASGMPWATGFHSPEYRRSCCMR
jgi:hypothetical protein